MRSRHDRRVQTTAGHEDSLWSSLSQAAVAATQNLSLPARPASPGKAACKAREAVLQVRFTSARVLAAAQSTANAPAWVDCWAVALAMLRYYALRWQIEVMHKVLKSGLGIERRALRTGDGPGIEPDSGLEHFK